jgi:hypothetical protein
MALHEIVYISLACEEMNAEQLGALLRECRKHNERFGITGVLVHVDREFLQLIEGEEDDVRVLFGRIASDRRHQQIHKLWDEPISERNYPVWSMALIDEALLESVPGTESAAWLRDGIGTLAQGSTGKKLLLKLREDYLYQDGSSAGA